MSRYSRDPYWTTARFDSKAADGTAVSKGTRIFYYPATKRVLVGEAAEQAAREFEAARFDEAQYNGGW